MTLINRNFGLQAVRQGRGWGARRIDYMESTWYLLGGSSDRYVIIRCRSIYLSPWPSSNLLLVSLPSFYNILYPSNIVTSHLSQTSVADPPNLHIVRFPWGDHVFRAFTTGGKFFSAYCLDSLAKGSRKKRFFLVARPLWPYKSNIQMSFCISVTKYITPPPNKIFRLGTKLVAGPLKKDLFLRLP